VITNIKVTSSNNNNNKPIYNVGTKCKTQNYKQKIKIEEKETHHEMFTQFGPTITYSWGEIDLSPMSSLQRDTKELQEISFNKLSNNKI